MVLSTLFDILDGGASASPFCVIEHPGPPVPKGRPRFRVIQPRGRRAPFAHVYTPAETKAYETALQWRARAAMKGRDPMVGPVAIRVFAMIPIPVSWSASKRNVALHPATRPDWDNYAKSCCDAMNGIVYADDGQIVRALVVKEYADRPGLIVEVFAL